MRLFVSVDLPDELAPAVADAQAAFEGASGLSFTDPEQAHVTLKFLGDVPENRLPDLVAAIEAGVDDAGVEPFTATFGGVGVFPNPDYIRVVWLGVRDGSEEMTRLFEGIEAAATDAGFDAADHEFTPHVTLARMEHAGGKELVQRRIRERDLEAGSTRVSEVRLTESDLGPDGPVYETVERFPLGSA